MDAQRPQPGAEPRPAAAPRAEGPLDGKPRGDPAQEPLRGGDEGGRARRLPDREVGVGVPQVLEAAAPEALRQALGLAVSLQVGAAVAREHLREESQVVRDGLRDAPVGGRDQHTGPALRAGGAERAQHLVAIGEPRRIEDDALGEARLQMRAPAREPGREAQQIEGTLPGEADRQLVEAVGGDQRPVEVDAHGTRVRGRGRLARLRVGVAHGGDPILFV